MKFEMNKSEMNDIHNARAACNQISLALKELFRDDHTLNRYSFKASMLLERALERYYKAEKMHQDEWYDYVDRKKKELNISHSVWSIQDVDFDEPHNWPNMKFIKTSGWEEISVIKEIHGNTWSNLWQAADAALGASDDKHHVFIESFYPSQPGEDTLIVSCGS